MKRDKEKEAFCYEVQKLVEQKGGHPGKIDWDTVIYLYMTGKSPQETSERIIAIQKENREAIIDFLTN